MYKDTSIKLTHFFVRLCYFLLAGASVCLPIILYNGFLHFEILEQIGKYIIGPFYLVVPAGFTALVCLDKLLINIRKEEVFEAKNVKLLRIISWACFYAGLVGLISFIVIIIMDFMFETLFVLSMGEFFMALILQAVMHVFQKAIIIKEENELTI